MRDPASHDPVFFDPDPATPQRLDDKKVHDAIVAAMQEAKIHAAPIFAYEKMGLMVSETNKHLLTRQDLQDWNAAVAEWYAQHPDDEA